MKPSFNSFYSTLSESSLTLGFFTDFDKVISNVELCELKLNQLNYLLGKDNLANSVELLFNENPNAFSILNILVAVRDSRNTQIVKSDGTFTRLDALFQDPASIMVFLEETGLLGVFTNGRITNLVDYVFGIEVGLDTNARKNRGGKVMAAKIEQIFRDNNIDFIRESRCPVFADGENNNLKKKVFDLIIIHKHKYYLVEINFYNSSGSKLNEVSRSYVDLAATVNEFPNCEFVWITDGIGWHTAKNSIEHAFSNIPSVFNIYTLKYFIERLTN